MATLIYGEKRVETIIYTSTQQTAEKLLQFAWKL